MTFAPGTAAPEGSDTVPTNFAVVACGQSETDKDTTSKVALRSNFILVNDTLNGAPSGDEGQKMYFRACKYVFV